jgi:hypothetical protein
MIFETPNFQNIQLINNFGRDKYISKLGSVITTLDGEYHSFNDQPAIIRSNGDKFWYKNGKAHRDNDLPAIEFANGTKVWYQNGLVHRENNLPAAIYLDGDKEWWKNGECIKFEYSENIYDIRNP